MKKFLPTVSANVIFLSLISFLNDVSGETIKKLIPMYLSTSLGVAPSIIGIVEGVADAVPQLFQPIPGYFSDKRRVRKPFVVLGQILRTCVLGLAVATSWYQILFVRFLDRSGKGIANAPRDALITDSSDKRQLGKSFGINRTFDNAGAVLGFIIAAVTFFLLGTTDTITPQLFQRMVLFAAIPLSIALIIVIFFVKEKNRTHSIQLKPQPLPKRFWLLLLVVLCFTAGNSSDAFLILNAQEKGAAVPVLFLLLALYSAVSSLGGYMFGSLSDRWGRKKVVGLGWCIYILVYLLFAWATTLPALLGLFILYGLYLGLTEGSVKAWVAEIVPVDKRATAFGIFQMSTGLMLFPASLFTGILWQQFGLSTALLADAAIAFIALVLLLFL